MSTGTLLHGEIGEATESMYIDTLLEINNKIKNLILEDNLIINIKIK